MDDEYPIKEVKLSNLLNANVEQFDSHRQELKCSFWC